MRRHGRRCGPPPHHRRGRKLHRRIFVWFGLSILVTMAAIGLAVHQFGGRSMPEQMDAIADFVASRYRAAWNDPAEREKLTREVAHVLSASIVVVDADGVQLHAAGGTCTEPDRTAPIFDGERRLGEVRGCGDWADGERTFLIGLFVAGLVLWGAAGFIARRLVRPLAEVARVARDIGGGDYTSRVQLGHRTPEEIRGLGGVINEMADRIEKQMSDQRELLAAVSHELRTPLGHMRVIAELAREGDMERLAELESEIGSVDTLVDQLLASSRLEFESIDDRELDAVDLCVRALERADADVSVLEVDIDDTRLRGDAMLLSRAIGNLVENAQRHADRIVALRVTGDAENLRFTVQDEGPGFENGELDSVFETFYRGERPAKSESSLGLGLALVKRIAFAHGGTATARNVTGGAEVAIDLPRA